MSSNLKILIADDDAVMRQNLASALRFGRLPQTEFAPNGKMAKEMIIQAADAKTPYHIVFLDWEMPLMSGIDVLKYFRMLDAYDATAFIMVTSITKQSSVMDAVKSGATAYLIKPVNLKGIESKMTEITRWLSAQRNNPEDIR